MSLQLMSKAINSINGKDISYCPVQGMIIIKGKSVIIKHGVTHIADIVSLRSTGWRDTFSALTEAGVTFRPDEVELILAEYSRLKSKETRHDHKRL